MSGRAPGHLVWISAAVLAIGPTAYVEAAAPRLSVIVPRGAQRGSEVEVTLAGERLDDVQQLMIYEPGIEVLDLKATNDKELKCKFKIETGCVLGTKHIRVRTATGLSDMRTFRVGAMPEIAEKEPNSEFATPQEIPLNVVVNGTIGNEDVDYFVVDAKKGDRITAEVEAIRLGDSMFDAFVAILNSARFELSTSDDAALVYQDGIASVVAPEDGKYIVQIRESSYGGGNHYRCHIGTFPRPRAVIPAGGQPGTPMQLTFLGDVAGTFTRDIQVPADSPWEYAVLAEDERGVSPSGLPFRISPLPNVIEVEPNNDVAAASAAAAPAAFNGMIQEPGDIDFFKFEAKKGQVLDIRVYGRQLRSELDSVLVVYNANGGGIASNDDTGGPDSYIRFNPPADGLYLVSVKDHLSRGGNTFHYRVELTQVVPMLDLSINEFDRYVEPKLVVPQGNRFAMLIAASRRDFGGPLEFFGENLPAGVSVEMAPLSPDQAVAQVILSAAPDAPLGGAFAQIVGKLADPNQPLALASAMTTQHCTMVRGQNNRDFFVERLPTLAMVVSQKAPYSVQIVEPKVPLVQNGVMSLKVVATRDEGFTAPIKVDLLLNPPGVNSSREVSIAEGQTEALISINAAGNAQVKDHRIAVRTSATVGNGAVIGAAPFATLKVAEPYVKLTYQQAAIEQGGESAMVVAVEVLKPFEGEADITLVGLPNKVTAPPLKLTKDTKELIFPIKAEMDAPPGMNKNLFCTIVIMENGEPVTHNLGSGVLRVDKPLPPKVAPAAVAAAPTPMPQPMPTEAPKKPLSRLEQLRLEQKQRLEAQNAGGAEAPKTESK
ncbi:MAG: PPC domain-containing protein [Planctomycetaceae bacterium]|nr:PPC domain-containing protein [Planctomycetaceae bacterium]